jgi:hypothetical protein
MRSLSENEARFLSSGRIVGKQEVIRFLPDSPLLGSDVAIHQTLRSAGSLVASDYSSALLFRRQTARSDETVRQ